MAICFLSYNRVVVPMSCLRKMLIPGASNSETMSFLSIPLLCVRNILRVINEGMCGDPFINSPPQAFKRTINTVLNKGIC